MQKGMLILKKSRFESVEDLPRTSVGFTSKASGSAITAQVVCNVKWWAKSPSACAYCTRSRWLERLGATINRENPLFKLVDEMHSIWDENWIDEGNHFRYDSWSLSHLGYLYPETTPVVIKLDHNWSCLWKWMAQVTKAPTIITKASRSIPFVRLWTDEGNRTSATGKPR